MRYALCDNTGVATIRQPLRILDSGTTAITIRRRRKSWVSLSKRKRVRTGGEAVGSGCGSSGG